jgi:hypothetical protein
VWKRFAQGCQKCITVREKRFKIQSSALVEQFVDASVALLILLQYLIVSEQHQFRLHASD